MYSDPQSLTVAGTAVSLPRTASGVNTGEFTSADGNVKLTIAHSYGKRARRTIRAHTVKVTPDPLLTNVNRIIDFTAYLVVDAPLQGFSAAEQKAVVDSLALFLSAGTGAANNTLRLIGGES